MSDNQIQPAKESRAMSTDGVFSGVQKFEEAQRMAKALSSGGMIPRDYQGNIPNTLIAMEMANRIGMSPIAVMQNVHVIHGKPSFSSKFIIAAINGCGRFTPLRFKIEGNPGQETCYAVANCKETNEVLEGPPASMEMAKQEGWLSKSGSKWKTMPQLMLRYRAATFFGNLYAPDILMGFSTADEVEDIRSQPASSIDQVNAAMAAPPPAMDAPTEPKIVEAELVSEYAEFETVEPVQQPKTSKLDPKKDI